MNGEDTLGSTDLCSSASFHCNLRFWRATPSGFRRARRRTSFAAPSGRSYGRSLAIRAVRRQRSVQPAKDCVYAKMFEPRAYGSGQARFEDQVRPFVFRAAALNGRRFETGERFTLEVNVFDPKAPAFEYLRLAFEKLASEGLGPGQARVEVVESRKLPRVDVTLTPADDEVTRIHVQFLTPTELKSGGNSTGAVLTCCWRVRGTA